MATPLSSTVLRWEFMRGSERLVCQVDHLQDGEERAFAVAIRPYRGVHRASVERFQAAIAALRRHAALASSLRARGWKLVTYTT